MPLMPSARFLTCVCRFLMMLFLPKFMINVTTLILKLSVSHFWMVLFLALRPMESYLQPWLNLRFSLALTICES